jgi:hypothetical protein
MEAQKKQIEAERKKMLAEKKKLEFGEEGAGGRKGENVGE